MHKKLPAKTEARLKAIAPYRSPARKRSKKGIAPLLPFFSFRFPNPLLSAVESGQVE